MKKTATPRDESAGAYDWESVEQMLATMKQKRLEKARQRIAVNASQSAVSKSPSPALCLAEDFELQAVGDSDSNSSDSESELAGSRYGSGCTGHRFTRKSADRRLKDSLDLSVSESVAELQPSLPRERHQATQLTNRTTTINASSVTISLIAPPPVTCAAAIDGSSSLLQPSSSALIQRRRQLEQEAAMAKDNSNQPIDCGKADLETTVVSGSNASTTEQLRIVQPVNSRLQRGIEPTAPVLSSIIKSTANTHVEPKGQSRLVAPAVISARTCGALKKKPLAWTASNQKQISIPQASSCEVIEPTSTVPVVYSTIAKFPSKSTNKTPEQIEPEDDVQSEEEAKLLRSLENLDSQLTRLAAVNPHAKAGDDNQSSKCADHVNQQNGAVRSDLQTPQENVSPDNDNERLRRAAYGGGMHHRSLQQTSPSVRTSCLKRAEISGGLSRTRVRAGAPMASETISRDADRRHKIVVKKDLAHLLFFN